MMKLTTKRLPVQYTNGKIFEIRSLSIKNTEELRSTYGLLGEELNQDKYKDISLNDAYLKEPLVSHYIDSALKLVGLDPELLSQDILFKLLFPHETEDGGYERQGLLITFAFGHADGPSKASKEEVDHYAKALGTLWASLTSFKEVSEVIGTLSYEDLEAVLVHRMEALKPAEEKAKDLALKKARSAKDFLKKQFETTGSIDIGAEINLDELV